MAGLPLGVFTDGLLLEENLVTKSAEIRNGGRVRGPVRAPFCV